MRTLFAISNHYVDIMYFNLFALYFPEHCPLTIEAMSYVILYHTKRLWEDFIIRFIIVIMQGKEWKHSELKQELKGNTNRSNEQNSREKWHQIARSDYVRRFYLQYHFPVPNYESGYYSRKTIKDTNKLYCACFQEIGINKVICSVCRDSGPIMEGAAEAKILESVLEMLKRIKCSSCSEQFSHLKFNGQVCSHILRQF